MSSTETHRGFEIVRCNDKGLVAILDGKYLADGPRGLVLITPAYYWRIRDTLKHAIHAYWLKHPEPETIDDRPTIIDRLKSNNKEFGDLTPAEQRVLRAVPLGQCLYRESVTKKWVHLDDDNGLWPETVNPSSICRVHRDYNTEGQAAIHNQQAVIDLLRCNNKEYSRIVDERLKCQRHLAAGMAMRDGNNPQKKEKPMKIKKTFRIYMMSATVWTTFCICRLLHPLVVRLSFMASEWMDEPISVAWMWLCILGGIVAGGVVLRLLCLAISVIYSYIWD